MGAQPQLGLRVRRRHRPSQQLGDDGARPPRIGANGVGQQLHGPPVDSGVGARSASAAQAGVIVRVASPRYTAARSKRVAARPARSSGALRTPRATSSTGCSRSAGRAVAAEAAQRHVQRVLLGRADQHEPRRRGLGRGLVGERVVEDVALGVEAAHERGGGGGLRDVGRVRHDPGVRGQRRGGVLGDGRGERVGAPQQRRVLGQPQRERLGRVHERLVAGGVALGLAVEGVGELVEARGERRGQQVERGDRGEPHRQRARQVEARRHRDARLHEPCPARPRGRDRPVAGCRQHDLRATGHGPSDGLGEITVGGRRRCARPRRPAGRSSSARPRTARPAPGTSARAGRRA